MNRELWIERHQLGAIVLVFLGALAVYCGAAYFEAASYRKITARTDVTTWDALWLNLRVCDR